jgi:hypothetical protein
LYYLLYNMFLNNLYSSDMAYVEDDLGDTPVVHFKMRFSIRLFEVAMRNLTPKQIGFLVKYGYDLILELKHKVVFPMVLIDWVMDNIVHELAMFRLYDSAFYWNPFRYLFVCLVSSLSFIFFFCRLMSTVLCVFNFVNL